MKIHSLAAALLLSTLATSSWATDVVLPPLNPSATLSNTVTGPFQDTFQFSIPESTSIEVSIFNDEVVTNGVALGGILGFSGFIDRPTGQDVPLTFSTTTFDGPGGSITNRHWLIGGSVFPLGTYTVVITGTGITGTSASYTGQITARSLNAVPEPGTFALLGLALIGLGMMRRRS